MEDTLKSQCRHLESLLGEEHVKYGEPMSKHSSLRIGGPAFAWIEVSTISQFMQVRQIARAIGKDVVVVGLGSNSLFPDEGLDVFAVRFVGELADWKTGADGLIDVGAGAVNAHLVRGLLKEGWVGMEFLTLIPGTFGGAVAMNAGTREAELSGILKTVEVAMPDEDASRVLSINELAVGYRCGGLPAGSVVLRGQIHVVQGDVEEAAARVKADKDRRNLTQPYRLASAGSTFANPPGDAAGRLIEAAGLKGTAIGGARVSELHANFFINEHNARAEDFLRLMALARVRVREQFGIELHPEVQFVGFDGWTRLTQFEQEVSC
jgi:UDP-N-acetylmuramate dehydrogenase